MDGPAEAVEFNIREPVGQIGSELEAESVLGRQHQVRVAAVLLKSPDCVPGNREMTPFDECHIRCDDQNPLFFQRSFFILKCCRLSSYCWS